MYLNNLSGLVRPHHGFWISRLINYVDVIFKYSTYIQCKAPLKLNLQVKTETSLNKEMAGYFPVKLRNITFSGRGLKNLSPDILQVGKYNYVRVDIIRIRFETEKYVATTP